MIPPEYIDWGAGSPADRRKLIGEIYSCIEKAADSIPTGVLPPVGSPAGADVANPVGISAGPSFKAENQCAPDRHDTAVRRTRLRVHTTEGHRAVRITNGRT